MEFFFLTLDMLRFCVLSIATKSLNLCLLGSFLFLLNCFIFQIHRIPYRLFSPFPSKIFKFPFCLLYIQKFSSIFMICVTFSNKIIIRIIFYFLHSGIVITFHVISVKSLLIRIYFFIIISFGSIFP